MSSRVIFSFLLVAFLLWTACSEKPKTVVQRSFYFWKNNSSFLSPEELNALRDLKNQKLYIKFFEVDKSDAFGTIPIAKTQLRLDDYSHKYYFEQDSLLAKVMLAQEIVPVVFVKNEIFYSITDSSLDALADNMNFLIGKYYNERMGKAGFSYKEIQVDCDWTIKTKDRYFYLLKALKKISGKTLSCTLRLYPYKYPKLMGIPPADKATLMCYNLINPLESEDQNSILDTEELEKYLAGAAVYPLHLDIALPVFSWMQVYQGNSFAGIISAGELDRKSDLKLIKPLWFEVEQDKVAGGLYLREGDKIKFEEVTTQTIDRTISMLKDKIAFDDTLTVTFFHLDGATIKNYSNETLSGFYTDFIQ